MLAFGHVVSKIGRKRQVTQVRNVWGLQPSVRGVSLVHVRDRPLIERALLVMMKGMDAITLRPTENAIVATPREVERAHELFNSAKAAATKQAYDADFKHFEDWCAGRPEGLISPLPLDPTAVVLYLQHLFVEGLKVKTIERALAGIIFTNRSRGHSWNAPHAITETLAGIRRERAKAGEITTKKAAITKEILHAMIATLDLTTLAGKRDHAILTLTWTGCARRSEIADLPVEALQFLPEGMIIRPRKTKTDPEGKNTEKGIPFAQDEILCATRAVRRWLEASGITSGALFRGFTLRHELREGPITGHSVAIIVKNAVESAGYDPKSFSGHSLRAGFITTAAQADVPENVIATQSGHTSHALRGYIRHANLFKKNAAKGLV